jgi:hypothetical protein
VVCVKWGDKYDAEYVNKLARGIRRGCLTAALPSRLVCFTEDTRGLCSELIETRPLPVELPELLGDGWHGWCVTGRQTDRQTIESDRQTGRQTPHTHTPQRQLLY